MNSMVRRLIFEHHDNVISAALQHLEELPEHLREGMRLYLQDGVTPGGWMCAVLDNDLSNAVQRCDDRALGTLRNLFEWLCMYAPASAWGAPDKRAAWQNEIRNLLAEALAANGSP
jgi:hypothetical protein